MKRSWIQHVRSETPRQASVGTVGKMHKELFSRQGFAGPVDMLYHKQAARHAPFALTLLAVHDVVKYDRPDHEEWELQIEYDEEYSSAFHLNNPMDIIGWNGDLFPLKTNIRNIIPINSDHIHLALSS